MDQPVPSPFPPNPYHPLAWIVGEPDIGEGCWIGPFTLIDGSGGLRIGPGCDISSGAQILTHTTVRRCLTGRRHSEIDRKPIEIGRCVFVGTNAVIQMGAKIGDHCVIGAGAVVLEDAVVPPYSMVAGVPARLVRSIRDDVERWSQSHAP